MLDKLWPETAQLDEDDDLWLGSCSVSALAAEYGTPLYIFDETTLRNRARAYRTALKQHYPGLAQIAYAAKAYLCLALAQLWNEEGLDLDVVSGGELHVALAAGFPPERIHFHGNNKTRAELEEALAAGVGRIVVDNFHELDLLAELTDPARHPQYAARPAAIWLRVAPGIQAHTHAHIQTGHLDTKFGFTIATGDAEQAAARALAAPGLSLVGIHAHIGSQIYETEELAAAAARLADFAAMLRDRHGVIIGELSPGGGWGVPMIPADPEAPIADYVAALAHALIAACRGHELPLPRLILEPGRSLVAPAGVALYRIGARKEIPGVRTYVAIDGGMADNIRPALYGAQYTARVIRPRSTPDARRLTYDVGRETSHVIRQTSAAEMERVTIAGKYCESGDVLIRDIELPRLAASDLLAIPMAGAYTLAMASNYNLARRPAVLLVNQGKARLIQRRETYADLLARDLPLKDDILPTADRRGAAHSASGRRFVKYQALGNDYLVLDPADWPAPPTAAQIRRLCDRHAGVGADGVLWGPLPAETPDMRGRAFRLRLFNPDGSEFEKSGNGLRIFARYLWDGGRPAGPDFT
ncbi:MAG: diaminopimelate decarboxylase, partial [Anaerolineae bacterium]